MLKIECDQAEWSKWLKWLGLTQTQVILNTLKIYIKADVNTHTILIDAEDPHRLQELERLPEG